MLYAITLRGGDWVFNRNTGSFEKVDPEKRHFFDNPDEVAEKATEIMNRKSIGSGDFIYKDIAILNVSDEQEEDYEPDVVELNDWLSTSINPIVRECWETTRYSISPYESWLEVWRKVGKPVIW